MNENSIENPAPDPDANAATVKTEDLFASCSADEEESNGAGI